MTNNLVAGIDFGTSNSVIGMGNIDTNQIFLTELDGKNTVIPTAVFFNNFSQAFYGKMAVNLYTSGSDGRLMRCFKSILGTSLMKESTQIGLERVSFHDIVKSFISHLKEKSEAQFEQPISQVVMGRPVHFSDDIGEDREAEKTLEKICKEIGFKNISFQYEPIAAALSFEQMIPNKQTVFVADLGGGTSDFSVLNLYPSAQHKSDRKEDILANDSIHIAGTDLDYIVSFMHVMPYFGKNTQMKNGLDMPVHHFARMSRWEEITRMYTQRTISEIDHLARNSCEPEKMGRFMKLLREHSGHSLLMATELAKTDLSQYKETDIDLYEVDDNLEIYLTKKEFEDITNDQVLSIRKKAEETIKTSGVNPKKIDSILLTGGTSLVPVVAQNIQAICPNAKIERICHFSSVARGLTIDAMRKFGNYRQ